LSMRRHRVVLEASSWDWAIRLCGSVSQMHCTEHVAVLVLVVHQYE
jgi:hypothetical protein